MERERVEEERKTARELREETRVQNLASMATQQALIASAQNLLDRYFILTLEMLLYLVNVRTSKTSSVTTSQSVKEVPSDVTFCESPEDCDSEPLAVVIQLSDMESLIRCVS